MSISALVDMAREAVRKTGLRPVIAYEMGTPVEREFRFKDYTLVVDMRVLERYKNMIRRALLANPGMVITREGMTRINAMSLCITEEEAELLLVFIKSYRERWGHERDGASS